MNKTLKLAFAVVASAVLLGNVSCVTKKSNEPPRKKISSMPHNIPASWEGQGGLPGMGGSR